MAYRKGFAMRCYTVVTLSLRCSYQPVPSKLGIVKNAFGPTQAEPLSARLGSARLGSARLGSARAAGRGECSGRIGSASGL